MRRRGVEGQGLQVATKEKPSWRRIELNGQAQSTREESHFLDRALFVLSRHVYSVCCTAYGKFAGLVGFVRGSQSRRRADGCTRFQSPCLFGSLLVDDPNRGGQGGLETNRTHNQKYFHNWLASSRLVLRSLCLAGPAPSRRATGSEAGVVETANLLFRSKPAENETNSPLKPGQIEGEP